MIGQWSHRRGGYQKVPRGVHTLLALLGIAVPMRVCDEGCSKKVDCLENVCVLKGQYL